MDALAGPGHVAVDAVCTQLKGDMYRFSSFNPIQNSNGEVRPRLQEPQRPTALFTNHQAAIAGRCNARCV